MSYAKEIEREAQAIERRRKAEPVKAAVLDQLWELLNATEPPAQRDAIEWEILRVSAIPGDASRDEPWRVAERLIGAGVSA